MAQAIVCDRCYKTITGNDEYYAFGAYKCSTKYYNREWRPDLEYDLCKECMNDFKDFIKNNTIS